MRCTRQFSNKNVYSCIEIYASCIEICAYSCLKLLSNRPEIVFKQQRPCSNHESVQWFLTENAHCGPYFVSVKLLYFGSLPFSNICKKICQCHASFHANYVTVLNIPKWLTLKNFYQFSVNLYIFYVIFGYTFNRIIEKMQE